jgi:hypothetical protein
MYQVTTTAQLQFAATLQLLGWRFHLSWDETHAKTGDRT